ncbi:MAG: hypothetical protein IKU13_04160 [Clostridia bacterium]|nr:hypothetical protein [Clostridia bacterium]MBR5265184.1 hypothetical protein [Clostridia bacterium]
MRRFIVLLSVLCLLLAGCSEPKTEVTTAAVEATTAAATEATTSAPVETTATEAESTAADEGSDTPDFVYEDYAQQIERYYTAISEQWDESTYFENEMSAMAAYYYEGNALDNVGFACIDLDGDDTQELVIGAIQNADKQPLVFEIWTLKDGEPEMLAQSGSRNRYYLQYAEDDKMWSVANEAENGAANNAVYYLQLTEGKFEVMQGIVFDAAANEDEPWFMAYDLDWDVSNDSPIDEDTANAVMEAGRNIYSAIEYIPYSQCR